MVAPLSPVNKQGHIPPQPTTTTTEINWAFPVQSMTYCAVDVLYKAWPAMSWNGRSMTICFWVNFNLHLNRLGTQTHPCALRVPSRDVVIVSVCFRNFPGKSKYGGAQCNEGYSESFWIMFAGVLRNSLRNHAHPQKAHIEHISTASSRIIFIEKGNSR